MGKHMKHTFCAPLPGTKVGIVMCKRKSPNNRALSMVRVTGLEPAFLTEVAPNDSATSLELMFSYLTNAIIARISAVVK